MADELTVVERSETIPETSSETLGEPTKEATAPGPPRRRSRGRRIALRSFQAMIGLIVGLALTEWIFRARDDGAFPHFHGYVADAKLGVRLRPGFEQKIRFGSPNNPVTTVHVNADGYRGVDWATSESPLLPEVLVVGDSQVLGLGVENEETFSWVLEESGLPDQANVLNAGVPTYGPPEYTAVVEEVLSKRQIHTVVYTLNMANDMFEAKRPNIERHAVWDGWAVRKETAPDSVFQFPGRAWLFGESHAFYALRGWWYRRGPQLDDRGFSSEGTWNDLVSIGQTSNAEHDSAKKETSTLHEQWQQDLDEAARGVVEAQQKVDTLTMSTFDALKWTKGNRQYFWNKGTPGDIVEFTDVPASDENAEGGRTEAFTAKEILHGAEVRKLVYAEVLRRSEEAIAKENAAAKLFLGSVEEQAAREKRLAELRAAPARIIEASSPLRPELARVKALCAAHRARLVVLVLPLDVQVSVDEWKKYGQPPIDMAPTRVLIDDVVRAARSLDIDVLDATDALQQAEPGAFLEGDLHMTPKGHSAVAHALQPLIVDHWLPRKLLPPQ